MSAFLEIQFKTKNKQNLVLLITRPTELPLLLQGSSKLLVFAILLTYIHIFLPGVGSR